MNREEADQDVTDEVSEEVDSRGEVMLSEKNDWYFLRRHYVNRRRWKLAYHSKTQTKFSTSRSDVGLKTNFIETKNVATIRTLFLVRESSTVESKTQGLK